VHCCAFFLFDKLFRVFDVFDGSIVMVLATKGICRRCFVVFKILVVLSGVAMRVSEPWKSLPLLSPRSLFCVCVCVFFLLLHGLRASELEVFWISIQ
jgi:hypothetical protein